MKVTILGSGTMVPSLERNSAAVLVENDGIQSLVDFGYGTLHQLARLGLTYHDIDRVYFTHNHPDHMCDLVPFLFATRYPQDPRTKPLQIVAAPGFEGYFHTLMDAYHRWLVPTEYEIEILVQDEATREYDGLTVETRKVRHMDLSRAYRMTGPTGQSVVISGDTDTCDSLVHLAHKADLLILECSFPDEQKVEGHLSPTPAARMAERAQCQTLCLTHFYPPCDLERFRAICAKEFSGELVFAEDRKVFDL